MSRTGATVAADVEVVALLAGDQPEVLARGLGALADAARDGPLELMRGPQATVAQLDPDREPDRVLHAEPAPARPHAALHGAQGLAVGVAALEPGGDQLGPDLGQEVDRGTEEVDPLA